MFGIFCWSRILFYMFFHVGDFEAPKNIHLSVTQKKTAPRGARVDPPHKKGENEVMNFDQVE